MTIVIESTVSSTGSLSMFGWASPPGTGLTLLIVKVGKFGEIG